MAASVDRSFESLEQELFEVSSDFTFEPPHTSSPGSSKNTTIGESSNVNGESSCNATFEDSFLSNDLFSDDFSRMRVNISHSESAEVVNVGQTDSSNGTIEISSSESDKEEQGQQPEVLQYTGRCYDPQHVIVLRLYAHYVKYMNHNSVENLMDDFNDKETWKRIHNTLNVRKDKPATKKLIGDAIRARVKKSVREQVEKYLESAKFPREFILNYRKMSELEAKLVARLKGN